MRIPIEKKKEEAIHRMKKMGIFPQTIRSFDKDGYVSISEPPFGAFYWAEGEDLDRIREFEKEYNALVYLVVRSFTNIRKMDSFFYVSDYGEEWASDDAGLDDKEQLVYVYNHDAPECSEFGCIGFERTIAAGIKRTW